MHAHTSKPLHAHHVFTRCPAHAVIVLSACLAVSQAIHLPYLDLSIDLSIDFLAISKPLLSGPQDRGCRLPDLVRRCVSFLMLLS